MAVVSAEKYDIAACYALCVAIIEDAWRHHDWRFLKYGWITQALGVQATDLGSAIAKRRLNDLLTPGLEP